MVLLESCKGCGASEFHVKNDKGYDFLICSHCKAVVALLSDGKKPAPSPTNRDFVGFSGWQMTDFQIVSSGQMYSGFPMYNFTVGS